MQSSVPRVVNRLSRYDLRTAFSNSLDLYLRDTHGFFSNLLQNQGVVAGYLAHCLVMHLFDPFTQDELGFLLSLDVCIPRLLFDSFMVVLVHARPSKKTRPIVLEGDPGVRRFHPKLCTLELTRLRNSRLHSVSDSTSLGAHGNSNEIWLADDRLKSASPSMGGAGEAPGDRLALRAARFNSQTQSGGV